MCLIKAKWMIQIQNNIYCPSLLTRKCKKILLTKYYLCMLPGIWMNHWMNRCWREARNLSTLLCLGLWWFHSKINQNDPKNAFVFGFFHVSGCKPTTHMRTHSTHTLEIEAKEEDTSWKYLCHGYHTNIPIHASSTNSNL